MVIKSSTHKSANFKGLIEYILKDHKRGVSKDENFIIKHNLKGRNIEDWVKEYKTNEANRRVKRSNSIRAYHEVMSISILDKDKVTKAMLSDLTRKYIALRNSNSLCLATAHYDKNHIHVHLAFSGVEAVTGKALRVSKSEFNRFKVALETYQKERWPQLSNSIVEHGKKGKERSKIKDREYQVIKRSNKPSERQRLQQALELSYASSLSRADFYHRLSQQDIKTYTRNGAIMGVESSRRYQFGSLGYDMAKLRELDYRDVNISGIQVFRDSLETREREKDRDLEDGLAENEYIEKGIENTDYKEGKEAEQLEDEEDLENDLEIDYSVDI